MRRDWVLMINPDGSAGVEMQRDKTPACRKRSLIFAAKRQFSGRASLHLTLRVSWIGSALAVPIASRYPHCKPDSFEMNSAQMSSDQV
jgi:hypothetical protein